ncbi:TNF receptor-associated factor 6-like [Physella acuta]|uniref:TNF receptor-associated factor 6-like n=1 Tax=Physella acuta TaxID=109671 RepID=UPI0027DB080B|nr:TNF receptor-associated factor 6-like [Physella acuta]XP_059170944.1 TNF receptor-associated factor 6-like [Physella acuta]
MTFNSFGQSSYRSGRTSSSCSDSSFSFSQAMEGYDYEFVPPLEQRYECPICLLILREPRQTKCGHRFCRDCIIRWLRDSCTRCPVDNETLVENDVFPDNFAKREILNFNIRCPNTKDGCQQIIPLGKLQNHLDVCPHSLMPCPNKCASILHRCDMEHHIAHFCEFRLVACEFCSTSVKANLLEVHSNVCPKAKVSCQHCELPMCRDEMQDHLQRDCQQMQIHCPFYPLGCGHVIMRSKENEHLITECASHMKQLCFAVTRLANHSGTHMIDPNECTENSLSDGLAGTMKNLLQSFNSFSTADTAAGNLSSRDAGNSASLHSTFQALQLARVSDSCSEDESCRKEILTHHNYKDNVHFSSATNLHTRGEDGRQNSTSPVHYSDPGSETSRASASQSVKPKLPLRRLSFQAHPPLTQDSCSLYYKENSASEQITEASSSQMFRYIQELSSQFEARAAQQQQRIEELQKMVVSVEKTNSDLVAKVKELEVQVDKEKEGRFYNGDFYWKIQEFSQYQLKAVAGEPTMLHSPPFYTSAWGYKLCVRANITSQQPPYLSLFVHFMQGQNDHILSWPFSGKIVLTIVDQNPDVNARIHISETLTAKPHLAAFQRPTTVRNHKGFGYVEFIQLPSLRQYYTVDDTVIIRAQVFSDQ